MLLLRGCEKNQEKKWKRWRANRKKTETQRQSVTISLVRNYHDERIAFIQFAIVHVFERETFSDTDIALATLTRSVAHCAAYQPSDKTIVVVECVSEKSIQAIEFFSFYCFCFLFIGIRHCLWKVFYLPFLEFETNNVRVKRKNIDEAYKEKNDNLLMWVMMRTRANRFLTRYR